MTRHLLAVVAILEVCTGLALLVTPSLVGQLLLGVAFEGATIAVAWITGVALVGLGIACWPGPPAVGMIVYSSGVGVCLGYLGIAEGVTGPLLWPVVVLHLAIAVILGGRLARGASH
jgi:hypothetical protein